MMRTDSDLRHLAGRLHRSSGVEAHPSRFDGPAAQSGDEDAEIAKATLYASTGTLVLLLIVLAVIAFGQEAMHWLGVH